MKGFMRIVLIIVVAGAISSGGPVWGAIITVEVGGVVDFFRTEGGFALDGSVGVGSVMSGFCTYDTEAQNLLPPGANGQYPVISISMSLGNYVFTHEPTSGDAGLFNVYTGDRGYTAGTDTPSFDGTIYVGGSPQAYDDIIWGFRGLGVFGFGTSSSEHITSNALPDLDSWPDLSVFDINRGFTVSFYESYGSYGSFDVMGEITSLNVVPEPGTVLMLGLGGLVLVGKRRH